MGLLASISLIGNILIYFFRNIHRIYLLFQDTNSDEILKEISSFNTHSAVGPDGIPAKVVKIISQESCTVLADIFNSSKTINGFPSELKCADRTPVPKKGDLTNKTNFRPISVLPSISKVFERIMLKQINSFFSEKLPPILGGYKKGYSCQHSLLRLIENWKRCLDKKGIVGTALIDLSKAFDLIDHGLLIAKLAAYGFSKNALYFIYSYLQGRKQRIKLNGVFSEWENILAGVPQGSILGPMLFNIFINDFILFIESCDICNYVDDNTLSACSNTLSSVTESLENDIKNVIDWFYSNRMVMNQDKCQFMYLSSHIQFPHTFNLNGIISNVKQSVELLGIEIDNKLTFKHIEQLCKKARNKLYALKRLRSFISEERAVLLANTFILSQFNYSPLIWMFCSKTLNTKINRVHERTLRTIYKNYESNFSTLLHKSKGVTIHVRNLQYLMVEVFKSIHNASPIFMSDIFKPAALPYNLRVKDKLIIPKVKNCL